MARYSISQFWTLGTVDAHGKRDESSSMTYAVIDNLTDEVISEHVSYEQASHHLDKLIGLVSVTHFACPDCEAESGEWCFKWRRDSDGERYKEVMGGSLLTCPSREIGRAHV